MRDGDTVILLWSALSYAADTALCQACKSVRFETMKLAGLGCTRKPCEMGVY